MSTVQNTYVDYKNLGDTGTAAAAAIQPLNMGEPASPTVLNRPIENVRSRTEILRNVFEDLLYYRDHSQYLLQLASSGHLTWGIGGVGRVNNETALTIRPFLTPRTNVKGLLTIGTAASNQLIYTVAPTAYASDGVNAITVEHRSITGTVTAVAAISAGPVYRILVVFDAANTGHSASVIAGLVNAQIAATPGLTGRLTVTTSAVPAVAILATTGEIAITGRAHPAGVTGRATADVEEHTLAAGALGTFTTTNPLVDGDVIAIRYDYLTEPVGNTVDPKGGVAGGRAESNTARGNTDVSGNLFIAQLRPELIPGSIPLCRVQGTTLHWVDGTTMSLNTRALPGQGLGTYIDPTVFSGVQTTVSNGGLDDTAASLQAVLVSANERLGQLRSATWVVTDGTSSTGGNFNSFSGFEDACNASINGATIVVRRGAHRGIPPLGFAYKKLTIRGEANNGLLTGITTLTANQTGIVNAPVSLETLTYRRATSFTTVFSNDLTMTDVIVQAGAIQLSGPSPRVRIDNCQVLNTISTGTHGAGAFMVTGLRAHVTNSVFSGVDPLALSAVAACWQGDGVQNALYENCVFTSNSASAQPFAFQNTTSQTTFVNCTFTRTDQLSAVALEILADLVGNVVFKDCRFINDTGMQVAYLSPVSGTVTFENCEFVSSGSPSGASTLRTPALVVCPSGTGAVIMRDCRLTGSETNYTGMQRSFVYLGMTQDRTKTSGRVNIDGLHIVLQGGSTTLPPSSVVDADFDAATHPCSIRRLTVDTRGKLLPTVTNTTAATGGYPSVISVAGPTISGPGVQPRSRLTLEDFNIYNLNGAQSNVTTCRGRVVTLTNCKLTRLYTYLVTTPTSTNYHEDNIGCVQLTGAELVDAQMHLPRSDAPLVNCIYSSDRSLLKDAYLYAPVGHAGTAIQLNGATVDDCVVAADVMVFASRVVVVLDTQNVANRVLRVRYVGDNGNAPLVVGSGANAMLQIENCYYRSGGSAGLALLFLTTSTNPGLRIQNNTFISDGALATDCSPNPLTVVDTASQKIMGNIFLTSAPVNSGTP